MGVSVEKGREMDWPVGKGSSGRERAQLGGMGIGWGKRIAQIGVRRDPLGGKGIGWVGKGRLDGKRSAGCGRGSMWGKGSPE
jgi:hypothetical protein